MTFGDRLLVERTRRDLTQDALAKMAGVQQQDIAAIENRKSQRSMHAPAIAAALGLSVHYMLTGEQLPSSSTAPTRPDTLAIPRLDIRASMGNGQPLADQVEVVETLAVHLSELRQRLSYSHPRNLRLLTGYGPSMRPTFEDGDLLLVDVGVTDLKVDAVYCLQKEDELFVKRITRDPTQPGHYLMTSDNRQHPSYNIQPERDGFQVLGKVLCVWAFQKL